MTYSFRVVTVIGASAAESFTASLSTVLHADSMASYQEVARSDAAVLGLGDEVEWLSISASAGECGAASLNW